MTGETISHYRILEKLGAAAWASFAHAVVMSVLAFGSTYVNDRAGFWGGSAVLVAIGVALLALA